MFAIGSHRIADALAPSYSAQMSIASDELYASPSHYLHSFEGNRAVFVPMNRAAYHRSIFLDRRISPAAGAPARVAVSALAEGAKSPAPTSWIFHVAHCGSTLLARALDKMDGNLVLREPLGLRQLALAPDDARLAIMMAMASKRYRADLPTVVKANVPVNFLLPRLVDFDIRARAIFLYLGLRDYLFTILSNESHRQWLRRVTVQLARHLGDLSDLSDAERCAALWVAQMEAFASAIMRLPNARSLDAEAFLAGPGPILGLVARHLSVPLSDQEKETLVKGPLFNTYSKYPQLPFNNEMRIAQRSELEQALAADLEQAQLWVEKRGGERRAVALVASVALSAKNV
ncbi:MAG TPA: hypothetical protein VF776_08740 [Sphingomicrobium sp.]